MAKENKKFNTDAIYSIEGRNLERIWQVARQLYLEERLSGDAQRDMAQELQAMIEEAML